MASENLHWAVAEAGDRSFLLYNAREDEPFTSEPIEDGDLQPISCQPGSREASETWSCGYSWYFMVVPEGIIILNCYSNQGFLCKKKSLKFIEMFLDAPHKSKRSRKPLDAEAEAGDD